MKNIFGIIAVFSALFWSCENKFTDGEFRFYDIEEPERRTGITDTIEIGKKGLGLTTKLSDWSFKVSSLKPHWHYSWGSTLSPYEPDNLDFVPMIWGYGGIDDVKVAELKALKDEGKIRYLLGFNEPDGADQANMTVAQAVEKWPLLESVGLPLGSPACVNPTGTWMKDFMQQASDKGLRVDFVCVHWYGGTNVAAFMNKLEEIYNLYDKPIWITEFAPADWNAAKPEDNVHSPGAVLSFMQAVLPQLEDRSYIERYAWFSFSQDRAPGTSSALFDLEGNLTPLGTFYANFKPNTYIGEGKEIPVEPVDPKIIFQDNFESYAEGASLASAGYIIWEGSATVATGNAFEGNKYGMSDMSKINFAFRRPITLEAGKTYSIEVATKIDDGVKHFLQVHPKATYESAWVECLNSDWVKHSTQITVTPGNEAVTVALYRYALKRLSFDDIVIKEVVDE